MKFKKSVIDIVHERKSTRTFDGRSLENEDLEKLNNYLDQINKEINIKARFKTITNLGTGKEESKKLGTYGFISGANSYVIGIMDKSEKDSLEFGYIFEKIVLFATDMDIQTCWLGGTFDKANFEEISDLKENEYLPIISPVGYKKEKQRIFETTMRASIGADKRKSWSQLFFNKNMEPLKESDANKFKIPLEMVRLGPSASNKQPWRIIKDGNMFHFFICRTKGYGLPTYDLQKNDLGIAKCHFDLTAKELGLNGAWQEIKADAPNDWEYAITWVSAK